MPELYTTLVRTDPTHHGFRDDLERPLCDPSQFPVRSDPASQ